MRRRCGQHGFSLTELILALAMVGLLASMMIPIVTNNTGEDKLLIATQQAMAEVAQAYALFVEDQGDIVLGTTRLEDLLDNNLNYTRKVTAGPLLATHTGMNAGSTLGARDLTCGSAAAGAAGGTYPCYVLQNGGILQIRSTTIMPAYDPALQAAPPYNTHAFLMVYDPDGDGMQVGNMLLLYYGGRVTTLAWATPGTIVDVTGPSTAVREDLFSGGGFRARIYDMIGGPGDGCPRGSGGSCGAAGLGAAQRGFLDQEYMWGFTDG